MDNEEIIIDLDSETTFAFNSKREIVYIGDVPPEHRGLAGDYYCLGCQKTMQVVLPKTKRKKHFRHHVSKNHTSQCTYSQETHRHFLAKQFLKDLNRIKVPSVIKYSDTEPIEGNLIQESRIIYAYEVVTEKAIYEDENCNIKMVNKDKVDTEKHLYIIPDAIILDHLGNPKLIVEFVATHKPDHNKLMKLKRLGIDAVQVSVPKSSPEDIKKSLLVTSRTKWLYNYEEDNTEFISLPKEDPRRVHEVDDLQKRLFEEGYKCRSAQIGELIRSIGKLLESELYAETERKLKSEIQRITEVTERTKSELDNIREEQIRKGIEQHQERRTALEISTNEFQNYASKLEERYNSKRSRVQGKIRQAEEETRRVQSIINDTRTKPSPNESIEEQRRITDSIKSEIESFPKLEEQLRVEIRRKEEELDKQFEQLRNEIQTKYITQKQEIEGSISAFRQSLGAVRRTFETRIREEQKNFEATKRRIEKDIESAQSRRMEFQSKLEPEIATYRAKAANIIRDRRAENEKNRKRFLKNCHDENYGEIFRDKFISNRIPEFEKVTRIYSHYLYIHRRIEEKDKT